MTIYLGLLYIASMVCEWYFMNIIFGSRFILVMFTLDLMCWCEMLFRYNIHDIYIYIYIYIYLNLQMDY